MIVFTNNTFHTGVKSCERQDGNDSPHLRFSAYIVENEYMLTKDEASKSLQNNKCIPTCDTCESIVIENIHYEGQIISYLDTQYHIDNLPMGKLLLGDLEKVGWVVLKYDYAFTHYFII